MKTRSGIAAGLVILGLVLIGGTGTARACSCSGTPRTDVGFLGTALSTATVTGPDGELVVGTFAVEKPLHGEEIDVGQQVSVVIGDPASSCTFEVRPDARYVIRADRAGTAEYPLRAQFCGSSLLEEGASGCSVGRGSSPGAPAALLALALLMPASRRARRRAGGCHRALGTRDSRTIRRVSPEV